METKCINCRHFCVWDGDPVCVKDMTILLPDTEDNCKNHDEETNTELVEKHKSDWLYFALDFFKRNTVSKDLAEKYLKYYPEHKDIIEITQ